MRFPALSLSSYRIQAVISALVLVACADPAGASAQEGLEKLRRDFLNPPADTRPGCYWYWINDNISTEGITRDLEAMARVGIGRAYIGHIHDRRSVADTPVGDVPFMSEAWWQALQWAVREAGRCGIEIGFFNAPGWSQSGGFWVEPAQSMRYLGHSETVVVGGGPVDVVLPVPRIDTYPNSGGHRPVRHGPNFTAEDFQDVRVVAFRVPEEAGGPAPAALHSFSGETSEGLRLLDGDEATFAALPVERETSLTLRLTGDRGTTRTVQTALLRPLDDSFHVTCVAEESDDGKTFRPLAEWREERGHQGPKRLEEIAVPLGKVTGEYVRLTLRLRGGAPDRTIRIAEVALTGEARLAGHVRKQLGETSPHPLVPTDAYIWPAQAAPVAGTAVRPEEVIDLTGRMEAGGRLRWDAPPGRWTILRTGMIPIGTQCAPCSPEARGLEIDKMNRAHASTIFEGMVGEFLRRTPPEERKALRYVIADSYETGPQNWTDGLVEKFTKRFGYSPVRFLPVMTGRVVDSPEVSDRFLWDLRRFIVESVATEYVGGLREIANRHGLRLWLENYGHWGFLSEFLLYGSQTDEVGGEFWESSDPVGNVECRAAASAAHVYGMTDVYAEAFTSGRNFKQSPATLKRWCDWAFGTGINHLILHVYIHQPREEKPGIIEWFGTAFNRHNTWFDRSGPFIDYMRRGAVMLKAGRPVADVAYYIGEDAPSMQGPRDPELPAGYDFDSINSDALIRLARGENGRLVLPGGASYAVLVLPRRREMRPEVAEAVRRLVREGVVVVGPRPERSPSLQGWPESDARVKSVADEVWGEVDGERVKERAFGKGWVHDGMTLTEVFERHCIAPDVDLGSSAPLRAAVAGTGRLGVHGTGGLLFKHRSSEAAEIYFLANTSDTVADLAPSFRQSGRRPWLWNAVSGQIRPAAYTRAEGRTVVPLRLEPSESVYVVFGEPAEAESAGSAPSNTPVRETMARLDGPWTVLFDGPDGRAQVVFDELTDWTKHPDKAVRYFSGTAVYERKFVLEKKPEGRLLLDLGGVGVLATVRVNGRVAGTLWTNPWEIDVTKLVREGENDLRIEVTNTWNNRLVAESEKLLESGRIWVSRAYHYDRNNPLLTSGLLGPVTLKTAR